MNKDLKQLRELIIDIYGIDPCMPVIKLSKLGLIVSPTKAEIYHIILAQTVAIKHLNYMAKDICSIFGNVSRVQTWRNATITIERMRTDEYLRNDFNELISEL